MTADADPTTSQTIWNPTALAVTRRRMLKAGLATLAAGSAGAMLAACGTTSGSALSGAPSETEAVLTATNTKQIVVASILGATNFDPDLPAGALTVLPLVYDPLFDTSTPASLAAATRLLADYAPTPGLASSFDLSADGLTLQLELNTAAKSVAGNNFTSADVLWSMERHLAMKWYGGIFLNRIGVTDPGQFTAVSDSVVEMKLTAAIDKTYMLLLLGNFIVSIFDSTEAKQHATSADPYASKWLSSNVATFGAYGLKSASADGSLNTYAANPGYYGPKPIDEVVWQQTTETSSQLQLLLKGSVQMTDALSPVQALTVKKGSTTKITEVASTGATFLGFNSSEAPYGDVQFRQGLAYAIPFQEILTSVYKGFATTMHSVLPSWFQASTGEYWNYTLNPTKAKQLLAKYKGVPVTLTYRSGDDLMQTLAVLIESSLQAVGLDITINALDPNTYQSKLTAATLSWWIDDQSTPLVPDSLYGLQLLFETKPTQVLLHYSNPKVDALVELLGTTTSATKQASLIRQAQKLLIHDLPIIPLAEINNYVPSVKNLSGFRGHGSNFIWVKGVEYT
jgi:peptide/nickel transport system substrate-binding protein